MIMWNFNCVECEDGRIRYRKKDGTLSSRSYKSMYNLVFFETNLRKLGLVIGATVVLLIWILLTPNGV